LTTIGLVVGLTGWLAVERTGEAQPGKRAAFMRQKLDFAKDLLEGLTLEDFDLIADRAKKLRKLSEAAEWEVYTIPHTDYTRYSAEFQHLASDLLKHATAKNLDAATISYTQLTLNCVNCHKFARLNPKR
jgi:hypothetical protein